MLARASGINWVARLCYLQFYIFSFWGFFPPVDIFNFLHACWSLAPRHVDDHSFYHYQPSLPMFLWFVTSSVGCRNRVKYLRGYTRRLYSAIGKQKLGCLWQVRHLLLIVLKVMISTSYFLSLKWDILQAALMIFIVLEQLVGSKLLDKKGW